MCNFPLYVQGHNFSIHGILCERHVFLHLFYTLLSFLTRIKTRFLLTQFLIMLYLSVTEVFTRRKKGENKAQILLFYLIIMYMYFISYLAVLGSYVLLYCKMEEGRRSVFKVGFLWQIWRGRFLDIPWLL